MHCCNHCNAKRGSDGFLEPRPSFTTKAIHTAQHPDMWDSYCVVLPIVTSTTFKQKAPGEPYDFAYARTGNPTRNTLEECMASLDGGKHGFAFSSGLGAVTVIYSLLKSGDHILCCDDVYGGTSQLFRLIVTRMGIDITFVDCTVLDNVEKGIHENTKMIWIESPTNPMMKVIDIEGVSKIAENHKGVILVVDNTFLTSYLQRPLDFGADIVMYSITKFMNGHSDVIMGAAVVNDDELAKKLRFLQNSMGAIPSPIDCYLVSRGLKTLAFRMEGHKKRSMIIANWLHKHPNVKRVLHPGLSDHPGHDIFQKQTAGHSSCFSFEHTGGLKESKKFFSALKIFALAVSLGGYESMAQLPCLMTHANLLQEQRDKLGISDALIRIAVGLEDPNVLINDLDVAFKAAFGK